MLRLCLRAAVCNEGFQELTLRKLLRWEPLLWPELKPAQMRQEARDDICQPRARRFHMAPQLQSGFAMAAK
jgi:hypothetical protein